MKANIATVATCIMRVQTLRFWQLVITAPCSLVIKMPYHLWVIRSVLSAPNFDGDGVSPDVQLSQYFQLNYWAWKRKRAPMR